VCVPYIGVIVMCAVAGELTLLQMCLHYLLPEQHFGVAFLESFANLHAYAS
jgi:hypothetical protein